MTQNLFKNIVKNSVLLSECFTLIDLSVSGFLKNVHWWISLVRVQWDSSLTCPISLIGLINTDCLSIYSLHLI